MINHSTAATPTACPGETGSDKNIRPTTKKKTLDSVTVFETPSNTQVYYDTQMLTNNNKEEKRTSPSTGHTPCDKTSLCTKNIAIDNSSTKGIVHDVSGETGKIQGRKQ